MEFKDYLFARPISEYHDDLRNVLWWKFPIVQPPFVGTPNDSDWPWQICIEGLYWTPLFVPSLQSGLDAEHKVMVAATCMAGDRRDQSNPVEPNDKALVTANQ